MECCTRRVAIFQRDNYKKVETKDLHISLRDLTKDER